MAFLLQMGPQESLPHGAHIQAGEDLTKAILISSRFRLVPEDILEASESEAALDAAEYTLPRAGNPIELRRVIKASVSKSNRSLQ
mmetsp:Transcript_2278/g.6526  ORF Transcript_2278/g.6526 Transcript_2278/m.6526 type:complete len:85 (-) Transcript_2278:1340-1594(-)